MIIRGLMDKSCGRALHLPRSGAHTVMANLSAGAHQGDEEGIVNDNASGISLTRNRGGVSKQIKSAQDQYLSKKPARLVVYQSSALCFFLRDCGSGQGSTCV